DETASASQIPRFFSAFHFSILVLALSLVPPAFAEENWGTFGLEEDESSEYYTLSDQAKAFEPGLDHAFEPMSLLEEMRSAALSIVAFVRHYGPIERPDEKYRRKSHFGTWRQHPDIGCYDVRGKILERHSSEPVLTRPSA